MSIVIFRYAYYASDINSELFILHASFCARNFEYTGGLFLSSKLLRASIVPRDSARQSPEAKFTPNT